MAEESSALLQFICNSLSIFVITVCIVIKLPQILSLIKAGSSKGLSLSSVLLEECGYSIMLTYHFARGYPITTYFEYTFLVLQDLIIILLILGYDDKFGISTLAYFASYLFVFISFSMGMVPDIFLTTAISLCTPLAMSSKLIQLFKIVKNQDPGQVSATTWGLAFCSTFARCITTLIQTGDKAVLINFSLSCFLNFSLTSLVIYYRHDKKKKFY
ncbi:hypothetical protein LOTGIDRAFT_216891 [Lottia gigantea]|uniref:Solute carrier family 66 member 3 n=1 Tax=Lottia gigantea TaxID=225164 RepID=V4ABE5_LOTGI|nr:hypothetical protein LOTGIDRAFT_216891 [Lottia gigantea]ESO92385.1 hypothetical protein LOTGIDRAFT_216891 [Lottia gigantea]